MSNAPSTKKTISQIYAALDSHSYARAVKLCQNLPVNHKLGQALLAHACAKLAPQGRFKALETIHALLSSSHSDFCWPELEREMKYAALMERRSEGTTGGIASPTTTTTLTKATGAKKSKGKKITSGNASSNGCKMMAVSNVVPEDWDWIDVLDDDPTIELADIPVPATKTIYDPSEDLTIRHTISATLKTLRLPITSYQFNSTDEQEVVWEHALSAWMRQCCIGDTEKNDKWLEDRLPEAWKRLWDKRKTSDVDEVAFKVQIFRNIGRHEEATAYLRENLRKYPDDWEYWKLFFLLEDEALAESFLDDMIAGHPELRGPLLVKIHRHPNPQLIMQYGDAFCERAICSYADIQTYLKSVKADSTLVEWSNNLAKSALESDLSSLDAASRRRMLQRFIFAVKVRFCLHRPQDEPVVCTLFDWKILAKQWSLYKEYESTLKIDQAQKEDRPPDELILLTVQRLLHSGQKCSVDDDSTLQRCLVAATLLEAAMEYSPHNFKLKLAAIQVYSKHLHCGYRAWILYQELFLKHIQHETCSHIILQHLISSGLFPEAFHVCRSIQDFHIKSYRELQDGIQRAMESNHVDKAHEFMQFHASKLQPSLMLREAKGLTLCLSPLLSSTKVPEIGSSTANTGELGKCHGIVGGASDMNRAADMISEVHNPTGSFDVLRVLCPAAKLGNFVDNRDICIKSYDILGTIYGVDGSMEPSNESIWENTVRRSLQHSLLIRATLCADGCKGLKKGKIMKCDPSQSRRCLSFRTKIQQAIDSKKSFVKESFQLSLSASIDLSRSILILAGGTFETIQSIDDIDIREKETLHYLKGSVDSLKAVLDELNKDCSLECASLYLLDCLVQLFALTRIATNIAETFGWGKKKRKSKPVAGALAEIARNLIFIVDRLQSNIDMSLLRDIKHLESGVIEQVDGLIEPYFVEQTLAHIGNAQAVTKTRLLSYFEYMKNDLGSFEDSD